MNKSPDGLPFTFLTTCCILYPDDLHRGCQAIIVSGVNLCSTRNDQTESSIGLNVDINYRTQLGNATTLAVNQLFFYTQLNQLTVLTNQSDGYNFRTANGHLFTRGFETNNRLVYHDFHTFLGYSFIDTKRQYDNLTVVIPLWLNIGFTLQLSTKPIN
ncbi:hypothetical protein [Spirosoma flavum]|uniref:Uncharacterized protein n=1 Tax=Spirosoma flavum TaxID=2048557 RepID=A0ABW6AKU0_9BACT